MNILIKKLLELLEEGKVELIDFEDLLPGKYSKNSVDRIKIHLQSLSDASILKFEHEDFGFRIEILKMDELEDIEATLEKVDNTDEVTKKLLNDIAIEIKDKSPNEAKAILKEYHKKLESLLMEDK